MLRAGIGSAALLLLLGGCGSSSGDGKASVSITSDDKGGATTTTTQTSTSSGWNKANVSTETGNGRVKIDAPGFKLDVDVPHSLLNAGDFEMDGVKLYPGSKVHGMDVRAGEGHDDARVKVNFTAPADPATVRGWMVKHFADKGHPLNGDGMMLHGTTDEGKPFTVALSAADGGRTQGEILVQGAVRGD